MKKKIPLAILEALQPIVNKNLHLVKPVPTENSFFKVIDADPKSDFFFEVTQSKLKSEKIISYHFAFKPISKVETKAVGRWGNLESVLSDLEKWLSIVETYNSIKTIYDDPIVQANKERFEEKYKLVDEDADFAPFEIERQLFLDEYLTNAVRIIERHKTTEPESTVENLNSLISEAKEIQTHLTSETKSQIMNRLTLFWAKAQKQGLAIIREILIDVAGEITKRFLLGS